MSRSLWWGDPPSDLLCPLKRTLGYFPSLHKWINLCRFWGFHACVWVWRPCLQGRQPHTRAFFYVPWWGLPYWSQGHERCQILRHIHRNVLLIWVGQWRSAVRGNPSTPAPITPTHLRWRVALTGTPPSALSILSGSLPLCTRQPGPTPVPSLCPQCDAVRYHPFPIPSRGHDLLTKTQPYRGALRRDVLWWHRTPSSWLQRS